MADMKKIDAEQLEQVVGGTIYEGHHPDMSSFVDNTLKNDITGQPKSEALTSAAQVRATECPGSNKCP